MKQKIGFVGLGAMGLPMAKRLLSAGHDLVVVPHVNMRPAEEMEALGATVRGSVSELGADRDVVITSVPDVPQVQETLFGDRGLLSGRPRPGVLFIDMSTINPTAAREHSARLHDVGIEAVDAPVSGGPTRAADGTLTIMVGGSDQAFNDARPILAQLGSNIIHTGEAGAGQAVKLVNQLMISIIMIANAEALTLGVKAGVPMQTMMDVIGTASGSNYLLQSWIPKTLLAGKLDGGFALDLLMKDLTAALRWAGEMGLPTFGGSMAQQLYRLAQADGSGKMDYSVVAQIYERAGDVQLRLEPNA
jgi:3-hydroxyisobutyrate dehydrogenase-like beta-hydroxyacid dehydrogenase